MSFAWDPMDYVQELQDRVQELEEEIRTLKTTIEHKDKALEIVCQQKDKLEARLEEQACPRCQALVCSEHQPGTVNRLYQEIDSLRWETARLRGQNAQLQKWATEDHLAYQTSATTLRQEVETYKEANKTLQDTYDMLVDRASDYVVERDIALKNVGLAVEEIARVREGVCAEHPTVEDVVENLIETEKKLKATEEARDKVIGLYTALCEELGFDTVRELRAGKVKAEHRLAILKQEYDASNLSWSHSIKFTNGVLEGLVLTPQTVKLIRQALKNEALDLMRKANQIAEVSPDSPDIATITAKRLEFQAAMDELQQRYPVGVFG